MTRESHRTTTRVRYAETDGAGVVYHANYLLYCEIGRTEWLRSLGVPYRSVEDEGILLTVTEASLRFRKPARYDDPLVIETWLEALRRVRLVLGNRVLLGGSGEVLCDATITLASVDRNGRVVPLPDRVVAAVT